MHKSKSKRSNKGFSLVELSLVITIAATVTASYLSLIQPDVVTDSQKNIETRQKMEVIEQAILRFRIRNERLPCPTKRIWSDNNPSFGKENLLISVANGVDCGDWRRGGVPYRDLGIPYEYTLDAWGRRFFYQVSTILCHNDPDPKIGCTPWSYRTNEGNLDVEDTSGNLIAGDAAYALISHGANGYRAYLPNGNQYKSTQGNANEIENTNNSQVVVKGSFNEIGQGYDDITVFKTKGQIEASVFSEIENLVDSSLCDANINAIGFLNKTQAGNLDTAVDYFASDDDAVILSMIWGFQDICVEELAKTPKCPGDDSNGAVLNPDGTCECDSGDWDAC